MPKNIRVLIVDDSSFMRKMLTEMIDSDPGCKVIKTAPDGVDALKAVEELRPDVVTMDIELPEIDGLTCIAYIMEEFPTPIVVVTGFSEFMGDETIKALEYGAVGLVRKPRGLISRNMREIKQELLSQIKLASKVDIRKLKPVKEKKAIKKVAKPAPKSTDKIVVIAASSGGPRALALVIPMLPADLPAGVLVVQHMPAEFVPSLAERLNLGSTLDVKVVEELDSVQQGRILFAPGDFHCRIESNEKDGELIKLAPIPREKHHPLCSADKLMISLAPIYGKNAVGVLLTGMGDDGTKGLGAIKKYGGSTIAEDESTCVVYGMPRSAIQAGVADKVVPLNKVAGEIIKAVER